MFTSTFLRVASLVVLLFVISVQSGFAQRTATPKVVAATPKGADDTTKTAKDSRQARIQSMLHRADSLQKVVDGLHAVVDTLTAPDSLEKVLQRLDSLQAALHAVQSPTNPNHLIVAAIKSISGERPEDEFFAAFWKFNYGERFYSLANLDIALSNRPVGGRSDSVFSAQRRLTDAGIAFYYDVSNRGAWGFRERYVRSIGLGFYAKIFNEEVYVGPSVSGVELVNSPFHSSYVQVAVVHRVFPVRDDTRFKRVAEDQKIRLADQNLFIEFFINSKEDNFFKYLAIRTGVLIPLIFDKGSFEDIQFRITVAVPIAEKLFAF